MPCMHSEHLYNAPFYGVLSVSLFDQPAKIIIIPSKQ
jgi:hypothetical protein